MYEQGRGVAVDVAKAWTFLRKACAAGHPLGCAELSQLYVADDGPRRDASRAAELAKAACERVMATDAAIWSGSAPSGSSIPGRGISVARRRCAA